MSTGVFQGFSAHATQQSTIQTPTFGGSTTPTFGGSTTANNQLPLTPPAPAQASLWSTAQSSTPANNATASAWPSFTTGTTTPSHLSFSTPVNTPATAAASNQEKGQIIQCLTESKNVQLAILTELKMINSQIGSVTNHMQSNNTNHSAIVTTHVGVFCNCCGKNNIMGARYKCLICKDYDMCEECEQRSATIPNHDPSHFFVKIKDTQAFLATMEKKPQFFNQI